MSLESTLQQAAADGKLLETSVKNIQSLLAGSTNPVYLLSVQELVDAGEWTELNDRFFASLKFGTGGLRGRTIGKIITKAEQGTAAPGERPSFACVGTNSMNEYNVSRATQGLANYCVKYRKNAGLSGKPRIVFAHDTRHFSTEFARKCAQIATDLGCDVSLFDGPRATPEMSFAVRELRADAGVMLTASHNPAHDNGYKVNFADGAGIIEPHATGIITEVNAVKSESYTPLPDAERGTLALLGEEMDEIYLKRVETLMLQPELLEKAKSLKIVYTALHGAGGVLVPRILRQLGFNLLTVPEQDVFDGRFPTVASPNPENAPALAMAVALADKENADIVIGTDPDCDRMGVGVRARNGKMQLLTGNQIGSLMGWYRIKTMFDLGILNESNKDHAVLIKTFVTTDLQAAVAKAYGIGVINTLTGFKYISAKLEKYEQALPAEEKKNYRDLSDAETRDLRLKHSKFFVFGGEESYGYLGTDFTRDKDGNGAVVMFAEVAAYAASQGRKLIDLLDDIYAEFGYFLEVNHSKTFEGAEGAAKIQKLADSYVNSPPTSFNGSPVTSVKDYSKGGHKDEEGDDIPKEKMLWVFLEDGRAFAVRPSGTEPKIKYYLYGKQQPKSGKFIAEELVAAKEKVSEGLKTLWTAIEEDIEKRLV
ncbi:phosphoglucomutase [Roseimicrobium gellanilyticum]|uniref:Phosphoglucomutase n=1 Tax=Roseimicrobium gellanilyticum TaxID=748857 RepID=A0A366HMF0_9BACT|nr:phospho-sugar mutase [Roseimicrobium gellanilyticum]RBP44332.1 phosphoglucomutase [Roseimicrobium gellanilyticum]